MEEPTPVNSAELARKLFDEGKLQVRKKCCGKCAFRNGSPERSDPWGWMQLVDKWSSDNTIFLCHEGIPGHHQEVKGEPLKVCTGWAVTRNTPEWMIYDLAHMKSPKPLAKFLVETNKND